MKGAQLKQDDVVSQLFVGSTHDWVLFLTTKGRVYRTKAYNLPDLGRDARGQHVANMLAFQPDEQIATVLQVADYSAAQYLVIAAGRDGQEDRTHGLRHQQGGWPDCHQSETGR